jgi:hypothetical protein
MATPRSRLPQEWHDRIVELRRVRPGDLVPHPYQWKRHTAHQQAVVRGLLDEVGIVDVGLAYVSPATGRLTSIDGHLRTGLADLPWPTIILDVTDEESTLILTALDESASLADADPEKLSAAMATIRAESESVMAFLTSVALEYKAVPPDGLLGIAAVPPGPGPAGADDFDTTATGDGAPDAAIHMVQLFLEERDYPRFKQACDRLAEIYETSTMTETVLACLLDRAAAHS